MEFSTLVAIGIGIWVVHSIGSWHRAKTEMEEEIAFYTVYPTLELIDGVVFARDQNGNFIGQGKTKAELVAVLKLNLPNKQIIIERKELTKVNF